MARASEETSPDTSRIEQEIRKKATTALVCGVLGLICCGVLAIVALVSGIQTRSMIKQQNVGHQHGAKATAGIVLGCVGIAFWIIVIIVEVLRLVGNVG